MAERLIIEIVHPLWFLKEYRSFDAPVVRIGRGYHNDLILSDPHVSAEHLIVQPKEEGGWSVESLGRENGVYVCKRAKVMESVQLESGDEIIVGKTRLKFFSRTHPVAPARPLIPTNRLLKRISRPVNTWSILIFSFIFFVTHIHLASSEDFSILKLSSGALWFLFLALIWAAVWAFVGRMIRHKAQFAAQLSLSLLFLMAAAFLADMTGYIGYLMNSTWAEAVSAGVLLGALCAAFLFGSLTVATDVSARKRAGVSAAISLAAIAISTLLYQTFRSEFNPNPVYYAALKPPFIKILPSRSVDRFLADTEDIFDFSKKNKEALKGQ